MRENPPKIGESLFSLLFSEENSLFRSSVAPVPSVSFLIVSAGFLILSADILIVPADAIRKSVRRRMGLFALSLLCSISKRSLEGKSKKSVDVLSPRRSTKGAKEHESVLVLGQIGLV